MAELKRKDRQELSRYDHGINMARALIDGMIQNPDEIIQNRGTEDLKIYKDILRDDQVQSVFQQRLDATVNAEWEVNAASKSAEDEAAAEFIRTQLDMLDFDDISRKMLYAVHYGYSIAELMFKPELIDGKIYLDDILVRDRARFKFGTKGELFLYDNGKKVLMPRSKFWIHNVGSDTHDNPYGQGLGHALYWPVFFKRNGIKFWLIFLEKFGMPTVSVRLPTGQMNDKDKLDMAHDVIDAIQTDSGVIVPEDFVVELIEGSRSGTVNYDTLYDRMNSAISKIILSQTMTTDNGSSQSQANVHANVKDDVVKTDSDLLSSSCNKQVIARLVELNFANAKPPKVYRRTDPEANLLELAERDNKIMALGFEPDEEYVTETYGPGWKKTANPLPPTGNQNVPPMGAEFADVTPLTEEKIRHRKDMQDMIDAAEYKSMNYSDLIGDRVKDIERILDEATSIPEAQKRIMDLMEQPVKAEVAQDILNATFFSTLLGYFRGKRNT
jgi:phage gp29-like protein